MLAGQRVMAYLMLLILIKLDPFIFDGIFRVHNGMQNHPYDGFLPVADHTVGLLVFEPVHSIRSHTMEYFRFMEIILEQ